MITYNHPMNVDKILISHRYLSTGFRIRAHNWIVSETDLKRRSNIRLCCKVYKTEGRIDCCQALLARIERDFKRDQSFRPRAFVLSCLIHVMSVCFPC